MLLNVQIFTVKKTLLFVIFVLLILNTNLAQNNLCIDYFQSEIKLTTPPEIWSDKHSVWLQKGIEKTIPQAKFKPYTRNFFVHNQSASVLLKFDFICIANSNNEEYIFDIGNPEIDQIQLYLVENDSTTFTSKIIGDIFPFQNRYLDSKTFSIPVKLNPRRKYTAYLAFHKKHRIITSPISILKKSTWLDLQRRQNFNHGLLFGSFFSFIILSLALFFVVRNTMYLYYGCYIAAVVLMLMGIHGYAYKFFFPNNPYIQFHYITLDHIVGLMFLTLYAFKFLEIDQRFKKLNKLKKVYILLYGFAILSIVLRIDVSFPLLGGIFGYLFFIVQISNLLFLMIFPLWYYIKYKHKAGLIFFLSYLFIGLSLIYVNVSFGVEQMYYIPISSSLPIASFFEIFVLSFYMIFSYKEVKNQKLLAENNLNKALLRNQISFFKGQEEEKRKTAQVLHDNIGSSITFLSYQLEKVNNSNYSESINSANKELSALSKQIRDLSHELLPISLKEHGIVAGLKELFQRVDGDINVHFSEIELNELSPEKSLQVYRIFQELLKNTISHAEAKNIYIQFHREKNKTTIMYEDDGLGFNMENIQKGLGLNNIQTRCDLIGAEWRIETSPNNGFTAYIDLFD